MVAGLLVYFSTLHIFQSFLVAVSDQVDNEANNGSNDDDACFHELEVADSFLTACNYGNVDRDLRNIF